MGHRRLKTTLVYTQLLQFEKDDNYTVRVARTDKEFIELLESGCEYISDYGEHKVLRKRK